MTRLALLAALAFPLAAAQSNQARQRGQRGFDASRSIGRLGCAMRTILAGVLAASTMVSAANAATIKYEGNREGFNAISITGQIDHGDAERFNEIATTLTGPTVVLLRSPGGFVVDGISIGTTIRSKGYSTMVPDDAICASVCGLMWLAGSTRFLTESSKIGFHAAFRQDGQESGKGNALVGAYLTKLGFSYQAVVYVTDAGPDNMHWLDPSDAASAGITYSLIRPSRPEPRPFIAPQPQYAAPTPAPAGSSAELQARRLVLEYNSYWSQAGINVDGLAAYYADAISLYGAMVSRNELMEAKRKFANRWPIRQYTVNLNSLFVQCDGSNCSVAGVVAWDCSSQERGAHSTGSANFALRIVNGVIVSENGSVLTRRADTTEQQQASVTATYAKGRQARMDYEQWISGLPGGGYKNGALFWAAHRSEKPMPPNCVGAPDWVAGCVDRAHLAPSDIRRATDKDFWWGWNSL
jgi:hypothetical protein